MFDEKDLTDLKPRIDKLTTAQFVTFLTQLGMDPTQFTFSCTAAERWMVFVAQAEVHEVTVDDLRYWLPQKKKQRGLLKMEIPGGVPCPPPIEESGKCLGVLRAVSKCHKELENLNSKIDVLVGRGLPPESGGGLQESSAA